MRHRCKSVVNLEINAQPPATRGPNNPWPQYPKVYGVDYGHAEVRAVFDQDPRKYLTLTKEFIGNEDNEITHIITQKAQVMESGQICAVEGSEEEIPCDLAILAMGFLHPDQNIINQLKLDVDQRKNIRADYGDFHTSTEGVFAAGDCRRGQSLVVWAINEGRGVANAVEKYFLQMGFIDEVSQISQNRRFG